MLGDKTAKKIISGFLSFVILLFSIQISVYASGDISSEDFFSQVKNLANTYDDNGDLASGNSEILYTNRLIVKTKTNAPLSDYYDAIAVVEGYDGLHFLQYPNKVQTQNAYISFSFEDIEYVEYDFYFTLSEGTSQETTNISKEHLSWNSSTSKVDEAINYITENKIDCSEVRVAVMDTGVYADHSFFENDIKQRIIDSNHIFKVTYKDKNNISYTVEYSSMEDDYYHGTHVSGTIFDNTMDNVKIVPYRITNEPNILYSDLLSAFENILIKNGIVIPTDANSINTDSEDDIDIINMSLAEEIEKLESGGQTLYNKITLAIQNGIVVVAAAGNDAKDSNFYLPARHPDVITVGATDENNMPAEFSNWGDSVDISGPGVNITSTTPRTFNDNNDKVVCEAYSAYETDSGTSYAAPLVAAAAAMIKSIDSDITPAEVKRLIKETAYVPDNWDESCDGKNYGTGIVNFYNIVKVMLEPEYSVTPTISINSNNKFEITAPQGVDAQIFYTLDGTVPTLENHLTYTAPLNLRAKKATSVMAACYENGKIISEPAVYVLTTYDEKTVFYKWSGTLTTDADNTNAKWYSHNPDIASVDSAGNIKGVSKGDTLITCSFPTGERIIWKVNVIYSPLQAFFVLFFFGFLWI